mmetsp:Transcript_10292/g.21188  ORF Transcript_10292/g.21188 Transcript_10292/m.21188 type:complete len:284 (-) Transcript_10292:35-886(-)
MIENMGKDPFDKIGQRQPLEEEKMRAAFTLREFKEHEQAPLLEATLAALPKREGTDEMSRRRYLDGVALGLQSSKKPRRTVALPTVATTTTSTSTTTTTTMTAAEQTEQARQAAELERQRQEAREREEARQAREAQDRQRREDENKARKAPVIETPQQALHKFYYPIFKLLWDMEFSYLGNTNPFRMVIDRENCASVGAPDYFDVIEKPMNLTYIQRKVNHMEYESLGAFFQDVDLTIKNALMYNSDATNPYRVAAEEMQKRYKRAAKRTILAIQKKHGSNKS